MLNNYTNFKDKSLTNTNNIDGTHFSVDVTTNGLTSLPRETIEENKVIDLEKIKEKILDELKFYSTNLGELNYRLAKTLYEQTKDLSFTDTHRIYGFVSDFLGISIKTIKILVWIYRKLEKFNLWHYETGLFKLRLFQLAYYISKHTSETDLVLEKAYYEIVNDFKLRVWFESASYKEVIEWFKMRFETYLKVFKPKVTFSAICDICNRELKIEEFNKTWSYLPVCFDCYDLLKEENKDKLAILKNTIVKRLKDSELENYKLELEDTKRLLVKTIEELDKIRLAKSRKYKNFIKRLVE